MAKLLQTPASIIATDSWRSSRQVAKGGKESSARAAVMKMTNAPAAIVHLFRFM